jgi:hypothetical protein
VQRQLVTLVAFHLLEWDPRKEFKSYVLVGRCVIGACG